MKGGFSRVKDDPALQRIDLPETACKSLIGPLFAEGVALRILTGLEIGDADRRGLFS